jgi:hypothetical protein
VIPEAMTSVEAHTLTVTQPQPAPSRFVKSTGGKMRYLAASVLWLLGTGVSAFVPISSQSLEAEKLALLATKFRSRLAITAKVRVAIVPENPRLASVRPVPKQRESFLLEIDESFLATLSDDEKQAVIAHEMGHVWIFTHHPYVHSEALANEKAQQLVSKESLANVYEKVWALDGHPDSLSKYLAHRMGGPPSPEPAGDVEIQASLQTSDPRHSR